MRGPDPVLFWGWSGVVGGWSGHPLIDGGHWATATLLRWIALASCLCACRHASVEAVEGAIARFEHIAGDTLDAQGGGPSSPHGSAGGPSHTSTTGPRFVQQVAKHQGDCSGGLAALEGASKHNVPECCCGLAQFCFA